MECRWRTESTVWILWVLSVPDVVRRDRIMLVNLDNWSIEDLNLRCG